MARRPTTARRNVLKAGGLVLGGGTITSLAGCLGGPRQAIGGGGGSGYTSWLPDPGELRDLDHYRFYAARPAELATHEDQFGPSGYESVKSSFSRIESLPIDVDFDEVNNLIQTDGAVVVDTTVPQEDIVDELEDNDYDDDTDHEGYTIYLSPDEANAFGVNGKTVVWGEQISESTDAVEAVETVIDTKNGEEDRYADESEDFQTLANRLGSGTILTGQTQEEGQQNEPESGQFTDLVAQGIRIQVNGETTAVKWVYVFEEEDDVETEDFEEFVDANDGTDERFSDADDISISSNGRSAVIKGSADTDDLFE